jgi:hypothetical protein
MITKCTEEKPQCSNCIKSNRMCGGYLRNHAFILCQETQALKPPPPQSISDDSESGALMVARWTVDPSKPSQPSQRTMKLEVASLGRQFQYRTNHLRSYVSSRHAGVQQILGIYLTDHLPSEALDERCPIIKQPHWLLQIQETLILTSALESSVLAVCLAKLGRKYDDKTLVHEALSMYTRGLSQLRQALRNPKARCHDETLATCLALMQFESTECPARSVESCMAHYQGAMNLLLLRSPEAYASGLAHCLYQQLRIASVSTPVSFHDSVWQYKVLNRFQGLPRDAATYKNFSRRRPMA